MFQPVNAVDEALLVEEFAPRLLKWYDRHGRRGLPWQKRRSAYAVWIAEIMLQQTQVTTVLPYYRRFMAALPNVEALAAADLDQVLHLWSGLGYYARARHLHRAAQWIREAHGGEFPSCLEEVLALPGIGRSTAGAILAQAFGQRHPILDGNVKRVLCRLYAIDEWPGRAAVQRRLWWLADYHTPVERVADYTQAIMDFGATCCRRGRPACEECPFASECLSRRCGRERELPLSRSRKGLPGRHVTLLLITNSVGSVLLERRPPNGIWGGLWSLPECDKGMEPVEWCRRTLGYRIELEGTLPQLAHSFSHFRLEIEPLVARVVGSDSVKGVMEPRPLLWYNRRQPERCGIAAPVQRLLEQLDRQPE